MILRSARSPRAVPPSIPPAVATGSTSMNVAAILKQKGRAVATIPPTLTLIEAVGRLAQRRIGALVVVDGQGEIAGIISERDVIRALAEGGAACLNQPVTE